jgi:hypothetical protein
MAPQTIQQQLDAFNPSTAGTYNPGQVVIFFDHRGFKTEKDTMGRFQNYWLSTKYRLGWPSIWYTNDLEPGKLRLIWYTVSTAFSGPNTRVQIANKSQHAGAEGRREYPLHMAYTVKDMYDHLASEGFRPMIIGWSLENPFPMIGGVEPPEPPKMPTVRRATTWSNTSAGHAADSTPHDRVINIIKAEEEREAKARAELVKAEMVREGLSSDIKMSAC